MAAKVRGDRVNAAAAVRARFDEFREILRASTSEIIRNRILDVSDAEMARRKAVWVQPEPKYPRGYGAMFSEHIGQADQGCDLDFLQGKAKMPEPEIH
mgnify:CR=1 FL=1